MPEMLQGFQKVQMDFADRIRFPDRPDALPGVAPERMRLYGELFFNNVESFIANGFPVLRGILDEPHWQSLLHDFFARHKSRTPLFSGIPEEFLDYLQNERTANETDPPFLLELAHYEWAELALSIDPGDAPANDPDLDEKLLKRTLFLSEVAWPLAYQFPVHRIGLRFQPKQAPPQPTCLVVFRDPEDQVKFLEINGLTYRLLQDLSESGPQTGADCLEKLRKVTGHSDADAFQAHGVEILLALAKRSVIGHG